MATVKEAAKPQAEPQPDEFAGQGGSYVIDPKTSRRTLVERTDHPDTAAKAAKEKE